MEISEKNIYAIGWMVSGKPIALLFADWVGATDTLLILLTDPAVSNVRIVAKPNGTVMSSYVATGWAGIFA